LKQYAGLCRLRRSKNNSRPAKKTPQAIRAAETDESSRRAREARADRRRDIPASEHAYRVRGIPHNYSRKDTQKLLKKVLGLANNDSPLQVISLAIDIDGCAMEATINFEVVPDRLSAGDEWNFDITHLLELANKDNGDEMPPRKAWLTIDDHFDGLTTLYSPSPVKHTVE
jgi:hypothetical protein